MPRTSLRGGIYPETGDRILGVLELQANTATSLTPVASVAAARVLLDQMAAAGIAPTPTSPLYLDIGGNTYYSIVAKNAAGQWLLPKRDESEYAQDYYNTTWTGTKTFTVSGNYSSMMTSSLPARPYARRVRAEAAAYGKSGAGSVNFTLQMHDGGRFHSRFTTDDSTVSAALSCIIPAGEAPLISAGLSGTGTVTLSADRNQNRLMVSADPISM
jgi:hypothetical protein